MKKGSRRGGKVIRWTEPCLVLVFCREYPFTGVHIRLCGAVLDMKLVGAPRGTVLDAPVGAGSREMVPTSTIGYPVQN